MKSIVLRSMAFLMLMTSFGCAPLFPEERLLIRVGIGMPVSELERGSTFPFAQTRTGQQEPGECRYNFWTMSPDYDLEYVDGNNTLRINDIGGLGYLINVDATWKKPDNTCVVSSVYFSMQNKRLSLDEVFERITILRTWLTQAGYRPLTPQDMRDHNFEELFIVSSPWGSPPLPFEVGTLDDVRRAFLNPNSNVERITFQDWISRTADFRIRIENVRRSSTAPPEVRYNETRVETEKEYYLYIQIGTRESNAEILGIGE